ncbi:hypothetical protein NTGM5_220043 [Candidatus Nitrotoga sp. M5]|nr:hypothetical protein NTGM5_220043 [Candidatus Nitrotoga sp. M5]
MHSRVVVDRLRQYLSSNYKSTKKLGKTLINEFAGGHMTRIISRAALRLISKPKVEKWTPSN